MLPVLVASCTFFPFFLLIFRCYLLLSICADFAVTDAVPNIIPIFCWFYRIAARDSCGIGQTGSFPSLRMFPHSLGSMSVGRTLPGGAIVVKLYFTRTKLGKPRFLLKIKGKHQISKSMVQAPVPFFYAYAPASCFHLEQGFSTCGPWKNFWGATALYYWNRIRFARWTKMWVASELAGSAFALVAAHVVLLNGFSCFYFCLVHGWQWSHWRSLYSRWATDPLFSNLATCLKRLRTPDL